MSTKSVLTAKEKCSDHSFLKQDAEYPAFSFFFRIHGGSEKQPHDPGHIRNMCYEAFKKAAVDPSLCDSLKKQAEQLIDDLNFRVGAKSVGLFISPDQAHASLYYINMPERQYVEKQFSGYESAFGAQESRPYLVFSLEPESIICFEGRADHLQLHHSDIIDKLQSLYKQRPHLTADKDGKMAKHQESVLKWQDSFMKLIAEICKAEMLPCFVTGLELVSLDGVELKSKGIDVLGTLDEVVQPNSAENIVAMAQKLNSQYSKCRVAELLLQCESAVGLKRFASGWDEMLSCAKDGRAEMLILESPSWVQSGVMEIAPLHECIRQTLTNHGRVEFVPEGTLKLWGGAAMLLRY